MQVCWPTEKFWPKEREGDREGVRASSKPKLEFILALISISVAVGIGTIYKPITIVLSSSSSKRNWEQQEQGKQHDWRGELIIQFTLYYISTKHIMFDPAYRS